MTNSSRIAYGMNLIRFVLPWARRDSNLFDLVPPSPGDLVEATRETTRVYAANAGQYAEATETYEDFPGLRSEVLAFAATTAADSPVLDLGSGAGP